MDLGANDRPCQTTFCAALKFSSVIHFRGLTAVVKTDMPCHSLTLIPVSTSPLLSGQGSQEKPSLATWPHIRTGNGTTSLILISGNKQPALILSLALLSAGGAKAASRQSQGLAQLVTAWCS